MCELERMIQNTEAPKLALRMRRVLTTPVMSPAWPEGARQVMFTPEHAADVCALLAAAYADGGGSVLPFAQWWTAVSHDAEFDPALCFVAQDASGRLIGVAQCWTSAFVKDLAVHSDWRRRGLGRALLHYAFHIFSMRGAGAVDLKVEAGNAAAIALYESLGMHVVMS